MFGIVDGMLGSASSSPTPPCDSSVRSKLTSLKKNKNKFESFLDAITLKGLMWSHACLVHLVEI